MNINDIVLFDENVDLACTEGSQTCSWISLVFI